MVIAIAGVWWVTAGTFHLLRGWNFGNVYEAQTESLLAGRADISCDLATGEAFVRDGKCYIYFGPVPGLIRLPVLWLRPGWTGQLSGGMVWVAQLTFLFAIGLILASAGHAFGTWTSTFYLLLTAFGSTIPNMWGWPTTWVEALSWAVALSACSLACLIRWAQGGRGAWLGGAGLFAMLAFFTRISTGTGPMLAIVLAVLVDWRRRPQRRSAAIFAGLIFGLSFYLYVALNHARMGTYLNAVPIHLHVKYDAERLARIGGTLLHPERGWAILLNYLLDLPRFRSGFPWLEYQPGIMLKLTGMDFVDLHAGVLPTMPALLWLAWAGWRSAKAKSVLWLLLSPLAGITLLVIVAAIAQRYVHEFLLLLAPAGAYGVTWALETRSRRWVTFILAGWSIYACSALALVEQREVMYWVSQDALDRYCDTRAEIDRGTRRQTNGIDRVRLPQTGSTYEFDGSKWNRCAGPPAHQVRVQFRFATLPDTAVRLVEIGKPGEAETFTLEPGAAPGRYRVRMDHSGLASEVGTEFELTSQRNYLFDFQLERMRRRVVVTLDGVPVGQRETGLVEWPETQVTIGQHGRWLPE